MNDEKNDEDNTRQICGNCLECFKNYMDCYCGLSDNAIDYDQEACIDFIPKDE